MFSLALILMALIIFAAVIAWIFMPALRKSLEEPKFLFLENSKRVECANFKHSDE
ncbi:MAG: hypothetical protein IAF58_20085 [Leptolyngbya sp.]|nr:hypothetical protein [Candidatus Melainabacteria bacterium]